MMGPAGTIFGFDGHRLFGVLCAIFWGFEWVLAPRLTARAEDRIEDRGSLRWFAIGFPLAWLGAFALLGIHAASFGTVAIFRAGLLLMVAGQLLRWWSIATLGRLFTINVAIRTDHRLIESGPYRFVRHPSYTAILVVHIGAGLCFGNVLSCLALLTPVVAAIANRIRIEEEVLCTALGPVYREYMRRTKRLIPGVY
ncbi:MAG TPA: isoprenylcysteine carboxylmethyltransferase family protein [Steroidobacteraceae bacterium]|nr:isoprenylcysteine carboxylmethyltransferase family protein [Steroidobacteraceae bacterium]